MSVILRSQGLCAVSGSYRSWPPRGVARPQPLPGSRPCSGLVRDAVVAARPRPRYPLDPHDAPLRSRDNTRNDPESGLVVALVIACADGEPQPCPAGVFGGPRGTGSRGGEDAYV